VKAIPPMQFRKGRVKQLVWMLGLVVDDGGAACQGWWPWLAVAWSVVARTGANPMY
jgi:hypothetical protein